MFCIHRSSARESPIWTMADPSLLFRNLICGQHEICLPMSVSTLVLLYQLYSYSAYINPLPGNFLSEPWWTPFFSSGTWKYWKDLSCGGNFHDTTIIFLIKLYQFYIPMGEIFYVYSNQHSSSTCCHKFQILFFGLIILVLSLPWWHFHTDRTDWRACHSWLCRCSVRTPSGQIPGSCSPGEGDLPSGDRCRSHAGAGVFRILCHAALGPTNNETDIMLHWSLPSKHRQYFLASWIEDSYICKRIFKVGHPGIWSRDINFWGTVLGIYLHFLRKIRFFNLISWTY